MVLIILIRSGPLRFRRLQCLSPEPKKDPCFPHNRVCRGNPLEPVQDILAGKVKFLRECFPQRGLDQAAINLAKGMSYVEQDSLPGSLLARQSSFLVDFLSLETSGPFYFLTQECLIQIQVNA